MWNVYWIAVLFLFSLGIYAAIFRRNLIHLIIGIEIMAKALCLAVLVGGHAHGFGIMRISEAMVITIICIEVATTAIALSLLVSAHRQTGSLDLASLRRLKG
ncbi:MAG: NADH-quinone oxidoreductase subunit K [Armatimonadota bacterium]